MTAYSEIFDFRHSLADCGMRAGQGLQDRMRGETVKGIAGKHLQCGDQGLAIAVLRREPVCGILELSEEQIGKKPQKRRQERKAYPRQQIEPKSVIQSLKTKISIDLRLGDKPKITDDTIIAIIVLFLFL
jgi:hypothetical protein